MSPRALLLVALTLFACAGIRSRPSATSASGTLYPAPMNGHWGYIDDAARIAIAPEWDDAWPFVDGQARVRRGEELLLIDTTGKTIGPATALATIAANDGNGPCPTGFAATPAGVDDVPCTNEEYLGEEEPFIDLAALRASGRALQLQWDGAPEYVRDAFELRESVQDIGLRLQSLDNSGFAIPLPAPHRTMEVHFQVLEVLEPRNGAAVVRVLGGTNEGIAVGAPGTAWKHPAQEPAEALGLARVVEAEPGEAVVLVKSLRDDLVPIAPVVEEGQSIALTVKVPDRGFHGVVLDLTALGIVFTDGFDPLVTLPHVLRGASPRLEMQVLEDARRSIAETAERERPGATNPAWITPLEKGRFAGRGLLDAMSVATVDDVRAFFEFVRAYPGKYIGRRWRIDETFATWVINGAPPAE